MEKEIDEQIKKRNWIRTQKEFEFFSSKKEDEWEKKEERDEKIGFSRENAAENILQGGYQISSDTMLWNMVSMEGMRENSKKLSIDDKSEYYKW